MSGIRVIGAGLAGCEAAWQIAGAGVEADLYEMKPEKYTPAQRSENFAELVCSNSLKAERVESAAGLLKEEMRRLGSLLMPCADLCRVPAGGALAVDRNEFSALVTEKIRSNPLIRVHTEEVTRLPEDGVTVVATGPLTADALAGRISELCGGCLSFYDAAAPIVTAESLNRERVFSASRYGRGGDDAYLNCPMNKEEYERFYGALVSAERAPLHGFDAAGPEVYEGCMPVEVMAGRGPDTLRFGPMKPVGLRDPRTGHRPWAVVQLRREDAAGSLYNLVGFQTNLKFGEQKRVFGMIPGLENAEFVRYGVMHRNTFLNSPLVLSPDFSLRSDPGLFFAGQITGVEGYMESAASGILAGVNAVRRVRGQKTAVLPETTMTGALSRYAAEGGEGAFQPMGANFGILPPLDPPVRDKRERYAALARRALEDLGRALDESNVRNGDVEK
jgi:methylenetetrahydrofolate--tRNA-(uracil-5-)-methyltransferase